MSQLRDIGLKIRAAIAIVAVWALMFGVSVTGAATASATDVALKRNSAVSGGLFACFKRHLTQRADADAGDKAPAEKHGGKHHCPCCLAASAGAALLPERIATGAGPVPSPKPVFYCVASGDALENVSSRSAHGARAPPFPA
ncbi:DUF2946 family protein [Methylocystis sp. S23]|jgi:hypothetical protein